ncbi:calpain small subunit 1 isoform X2 [Wyeomyia smithii]|uniref:calpain small subunit 1 isoform X2 n=1 Tax=Wyeomyia smithii TaxID=174621 RepID=UPI00246808E1|nr:calpain small subunit 1 isoform X2 [Wyeomyia smithii]
MTMTNKLAIILAVALIAQCVYGLPAPQWLSFNDGKFGVGFGGYHAEAGLGGFLGGNQGFGGLSASAGTPNGQRAGAGLGGILDGNAKTAGGAYAGASAGHGVGASAAIGGGLGGEGGAGGTGAEAHAGGVSKKVVKLSQTNGGETIYTHEVPPVPQVVNTRFNQDYESNGRTRTFVKEVHTDLEAPPAVQPPVYTRTKTIYKKKVIHRPHKAQDVSNKPTNGAHGAGPEKNSNFWNDIFNIPISTLNAVNQFLNGNRGNGVDNAHKST